MEWTNNLKVAVVAVLFELYMMSCINKALFEMRFSIYQCMACMHVHCTP